MFILITLMSMNTPISNIPIKEIPSDNESHEDDPEVKAILEEAKKPEPVVHTYTPPPVAYLPAPQFVQPQVNVQQYNSLNDASKSMIDSEKAKKALIATIAAMIMFYPQTLQFIYEKYPKLSQFEAYDFFIRAMLLFMIIYLLLWKLNI